MSLQLGEPNQHVRQWIIDHSGQPTPTPVSGPPTITYVMGEIENDINLGGCDVIVQGENLETITEIECCGDKLSPSQESDVFYTMSATYYDGALHSRADRAGAYPRSGYIRVTNSAGSATFDVEFSNH